jgi:hypothetical protein
VYHDYSCCRDKVNRAAGLRAVVMVFASPSRQFYLDVTKPAHLSGLSHLDNFIVTRKSCPLTGTLQKLMPTLTQTATPHTTGPLVVMFLTSRQKKSSRQLYTDMTNPAHLPGLIRQDSFIMTRKCCSFDYVV